MVLFQVRNQKISGSLQRRGHSRSGELIVDQFEIHDNMFQLYKSNLAKGLYILEINQNDILVRDILIIE